MSLGDISGNLRSVVNRVLGQRRHGKADSPLEAASVTSTTDDNNDGRHDNHDEHEQGRDGAVQRPFHAVRIAACQSNQHITAPSPGHRRAHADTSHT